MVSYRLHISETTWLNFTNFYTYCLWPRLGSSLTALRLICTFGFVNDDMFSPNGPYGASCVLLSDNRMAYSSGNYCTNSNRSLFNGWLCTGSETCHIRLPRCECRLCIKSCMSCGRKYLFAVTSSHHRVHTVL